MRRRRSPGVRFAPSMKRPVVKYVSGVLVLHPVRFSRRQQKNRETEGNRTRGKERAPIRVWKRTVFRRWYRILIIAPLLPTTSLLTFTISTIPHKIIIIMVPWMVAEYAVCHISRWGRDIISDASMVARHCHRHTGDCPRYFMPREDNIFIHAYRFFFSYFDISGIL